MGVGRKKMPARARQRRVTNTVSEATPTRNVYSYTSRKRNDRSAPRKKVTEVSSTKKSFLYNLLAKGSSGLVILGVVLITIYLLSLSPRPVLRSVGGEGVMFLQVHDSKTYAAAVQDELSSSLWNRSKLTIKPADIKANLEQKFPELESVTVVIPFLGIKPIVYIEPAQPALVLAATNGSYVLNQDGKVLIMQSNLPPSVDLKNVPVVTDQSSLKATLNKQALTKNDINFIRVVLAQLNAKQIKYDSILLPASANEMDVHITGQPYHVKFNLHNYKTGREQAGTFMATLQELTRQNIVPSEYIDVRLERRAYYK